MERYLNRIRGQLEALGLSGSDLEHRIRLAREFIARKIALGIPEADAVAAHERIELPGLLRDARPNAEETARRMTMSGMSEQNAVRMQREQELPNLIARARQIPRTIDHHVTPRRRAPVRRTERGPTAEETLTQFVAHLQEMESRMLMRAAQRTRGYITTGRGAAQSMHYEGVVEFYAPAVEFFVRMTPIVGDLLGISESILGRDIVSGEALSDSDRAIRAGAGIVGLLLSCSRVLRGISSGIAAIRSAIIRTARQIRVSAGVLTAGIRRIADLSDHSDRILTIIRKFQNSQRLRIDEVRLFRDVVQRILEYRQMGRQILMSAAEQAGRILHRIETRSGSAIRVMRHQGRVVIWRCIT